MLRRTVEGEKVPILGKWSLRLKGPFARLDLRNCFRSISKSQVWSNQRPQQTRTIWVYADFGLFFVQCQKFGRDLRGVVKKRSHGQADCKAREVGFNYFLIWHQNTSPWEVSMHFSCPLWLCFTAIETILWQSSSRRNGDLCCWKMTLFTMCEIRFRPIMSVDLF